MIGDILSSATLGGVVVGGGSGVELPVSMSSVSCCLMSSFVGRMWRRFRVRMPPFPMATT